MNFPLNSKSGRVGYRWSQYNVSIHIVVYLEWNEKIIIKKAIIWSELNCWPPDQSYYASVWPCAHGPRRMALTWPRGPGPAPRWPVPSETAHSLLSALLSSPLYSVVPTNTTSPPINQSPLRLVSAILIHIRLSEFSPGCFSLYVSSRFSTTKLAKRRFPKVILTGS